MQVIKAVNSAFRYIKANWGAAEVTQSVATVTDEMMTPEEWAEQWA
jgi:hypothetical protein